MLLLHLFIPHLPLSIPFAPPPEHTPLAADGRPERRRSRHGRSGSPFYRINSPKLQFARILDKVEEQAI